MFVDRSFDAFYDGQAASLLSGHWDVAPDRIQGEAFIYQGRYYGYFGFVPALPRMLLNRIFPALEGKWTRTMMLLDTAATIAALIAFLELLEIESGAWLVPVAALGSTLFFLGSHALVYHEAVLAGSALSLWAYYCFARYLKEPRTATLVLAWLLSFLAFFARFSVGAGPVLCGVVFLIFGRLRFRTHAALSAAAATITIAAFISINHAKFGTWLNLAPLQYHVQYGAERVTRIEDRLDHLSNIPFDTSAYFGPRSIHIRRSFPWLTLTTAGPDPDTFAKIDRIEGYSSLPAAMPALALLSLLGCVFVLRRRPDMLPILAAALVAGCSILTISFITYRYLHDFYPFLAIASVAGIRAMQLLAVRTRIAMLALIAVSGAWSIAVNFAFALTEQSETFWSDPAEGEAFLRFRGRVDSLFGFEKTGPIDYSIGDPIQNLTARQILIVKDPPGAYQYDGREWIHVNGEWLHRFIYAVRFPRGRPRLRMAFWFAGQPGESDSIYLVFWGEQKLQFCSDHAGAGGTCGPLLEIQSGREYQVQVDADRLNSRLTVTVDREKALEHSVVFYRWNHRDVRAGNSPESSTHGEEAFAGEIRIKE